MSIAYLLHKWFGRIHKWFGRKGHNQPSTPSNGLDESYLFDFKNLQTQYNGFASSSSGFDAPIPINSSVSVENDDNTGISQIVIGKATKRIEIKPIDALKELETVPNAFTCSLLDEKIEMFKQKEKLIVQRYAKREVTALLERLENRKKYSKHRAFFESYQNTTDEKIDDLLKKYDLVMKTSDIFVPEFPQEAIDQMSKYTEKMKLICDKKPVFYVIAQPDKFRKLYEKRDPILLVQSPFGFFWQILGAWDEEMLLLGEL